MNETNNTVTSDSSASQSVIVKKSMALWQKFLLYPAVAGALFGAIPTTMNIYKAYKYGISYTEVDHAEEQRGLWMKNFSCTSGMDYHSVKTNQNVQVEVGACPNGDVLISVSQPDGKKILEWVSIDKIRKASLLSSVTGSQAFAAAFIPSSSLSRTKTGYNNPDIHQIAGKTKTICLKLEGSTKMIRVVNENGTCYKETVQLLQGSISSREKVTCNTKCE